MKNLFCVDNITLLVGFDGVTTISLPVVGFGMSMVASGIPKIVDIVQYRYHMYQVHFSLGL